MANTREKLIELLEEIACRTDDERCRKCGEQDCVRCAYENIADHLIANGVTVQQWIPVSERLPAEDETVLVIDRVTGEVTTAYLNFCNSFVFRDGRGHGASYWMPLPKKPKRG